MEISESYGIICYYMDKERSDLFFALIHDQEHRHPKLSIPKGRQDEGETPVETAMRECWQEIGQRPTLLTSLTEEDLAGLRDEFSIPGKDVLRKLQFFIGKSSTLELTPDPVEVDRAEWVSHRHLEDGDVLYAHVRILRKALDIIRRKDLDAYYATR